MPGYADWKQLFYDELLQLKEEGCDLRNAPDTPADSDAPHDWEALYRELWKCHSLPLRPDYVYSEPNGYEDIIASAAPAPDLKPLSDIEYAERIRGGLYGRFAGIVLGKPLEMGMDANAVKEYLAGTDALPLNDFVPARSDGTGRDARGDCIASTRGNIRYVQPDDDVNYTLLALRLAEYKGTDFAPSDVGTNWLDNIPYHWFWCASRQAYYHMVNGVPFEKIPTLLNPWRECIDGQIRSDLWGYIAPADLHKAALGAYRDCSFSLVKNGVYGGMFVAGCISAALSVNPSVESIIRGGLAVIPAKSRLADMVHKVCGRYTACGDYEEVCRKIYGEWGHLPFAGTINNLAMVTLALLHGGLDYTKTITTAVMCGIDTDCNAGTAGSIVGAAVGIEGIEPRWYECFNDTAKTVVASFGEVKISEIAKRITAVGLKNRG